MKSAKIVGLGKYLPPRILTNSDLEKMVDTSDEWITTRTGIKTRHIADKGVSSSDLAREASLMALKRAGISPEDLDLIIVATVTPDTPFPSTACHLQRHINAKNASCFDLSAACGGYVYSLACATQFLKTGFFKNALIVGTEVFSTLVDWTDRSTCVLFGDGSGAMVLVPTDESGVLSVDLGSDGSAPDLLLVPGGGSKCPMTQEVIDRKLHRLKMKGNELFRIAVRIMAETAKKSLGKAGLETKDIDVFIPHQANMRIISALGKLLGIPLDKIYVNVDRYGNTSSASTAIALCEAWEEGKIKKDDIVMLDAFGGGLVWGSCVIKWI